MPENPTVTGYVGTALIQPTSGEATGQYGLDLRTNTTAIAQKIRFLNDAGTMSNEAWTNPTLVNSWVVALSRTASYMKQYDGMVRLRGLIQSGAATTAFTLPVGYRPSQNVEFIAPGFTLNGAAFVATDVPRVAIDTSGVVTVFVSGTIVAVALDAIEFPTF